MIRRFTGAVLLAGALGCANTIKAVVLSSEWDQRGARPVEPAETYLPTDSVAAAPGAQVGALHVMAIKARPLPKPEPLPVAPGKPQPTPRPTPVPPGVKPPAPTPTPTPPVTRPT